MTTKLPLKEIATILNKMECNDSNCTSTHGLPIQRKKRIVFALPGRSYSGEFLKSWTLLVHQFAQENYEVILSQQYNSVVHFARAKCLGADVRAGADQKPFSGQLDYDYIMWIDSDIAFQPNQIKQLIYDSETFDKNIVSGIYMMEDGVNFAVVPSCDLQYFAKNAAFEFLTLPKLEEMRQTKAKDTEERLLQVDYTGLGFTLFRKGVFEKLKYPWFYHPLESVQQEDPDKPPMVDMVSEDAALFKNLKNVGESAYIDIFVRVGHEKTIVL